MIATIPHVRIRKELSSGYYAFYVFYKIKENFAAIVAFDVFCSDLIVKNAVRHHSTRSCEVEEQRVPSFFSVDQAKHGW